MPWSCQGTVWRLRHLVAPMGQSPHARGCRLDWRRPLSGRHHPVCAQAARTVGRRILELLAASENGTRNTVSRMPLPRSAQTRPSQVTARSVTCGSDAASFNRPKNTVLGTAPGSSARVITAAIPHHRSLQEAPETGRMACSTRSASKLTALRLPLVTDLMPRPSSTSPHRLTLGLTGPNTVAVK